MSKKRMVDTDFWTDPWVLDTLSPLESHLFLYLFTNPQTSIAGIYEISLRVMAFHTGIPQNELPEMLKKLEPKAYYESGWVILRNGIKNQNYKNSKIKMGIILALNKAPKKLIDNIDIPKDFGEIPKDIPEQTRLIHDPSRDIDESSHSNSKARANSNPNSKAVGDSKAPGKPTARAAGFDESKLKPEDPKAYARGVRADEAQAARVKSRKPDEEPSKIMTAAEIFAETKRKKEKSHGNDKVQR